MLTNILIVDDSATTRAMVRRIISLSGLPTGNVMEAGDGQEGLKAMGASRVDLVLADLNMPNMDGVEMTRRMLADPALCKIPVVIISANPNQAVIDALRQEGVRGYLTKPFTPERFRDVLDRALGGLAHA